MRGRNHFFSLNSDSASNLASNGIFDIVFISMLPKFRMIKIIAWAWKAVLSENRCKPNIDPISTHNIRREIQHRIRIWSQNFDFAYTLRQKSIPQICVGKSSRSKVKVWYEMTEIVSKPVMMLW